MIWSEQTPGLPYETHFYEPFGADFDDIGVPIPGGRDIRYTGKLLDASTGKHYFNARYLNTITGTASPGLPPRFLTPDIIEGTPGNPQSRNRYASRLNDPVGYVAPDGEDALAIVFPDYKIHVFGLEPGGIGHAGILLIDNKTGLTTYYEYGRYDNANPGIVRRRTIPNVTIDPETKMPTKESLNAVLNSISKQSGHRTGIEGAYIQNDNFKEMFEYAESRKVFNTDFNRDPCSSVSNNCGHYSGNKFRCRLFAEVTGVLCSEGDCLLNSEEELSKASLEKLMSCVTGERILLSNGYYLETCNFK